MKKNKRTFIFGLLLTALSVLLFSGLLTFLQPCGAKDDGSFMTCHWMGNAAAGASALLCVISCLRTFIPGKDTKKGLSLALTAASVFTALIPNGLIGTCMMETMQCNSVTKPAVTCFAAAIALLAAVDTVILFKDKKD